MDAHGLLFHCAIALGNDDIDQNIHDLWLEPSDARFRCLLAEGHVPTCKVDAQHDARVDSGRAHAALPPRKRKRSGSGQPPQGAAALPTEQPQAGRSRQRKQPRIFVSFEEALAAARSLQLNSAREWAAWCRSGVRPASLPADPDHVYKHGGWQGWGHWLGRNNQHNTRFLPFCKALAVSRSLGLASVFARHAWCKSGARPANVPAVPSKVYKHDGWLGWGYWLGTGNLDTKTRQFLPFGEALAVALTLGLATSTEWHAWSKNGMRPQCVPSAPNVVYKHHGWQGWGHWLGTGSQHNKDRNFLPFNEALAVARVLQLASKVEWEAWCKIGLRPSNVPARPDNFYGHVGWRGWGHWLGTGNLRTKQFLPFGAALAVARCSGLASEKEWRVWCKEGLRPPNVPSDPHRTYKTDGWRGWGHWLGTSNHINQRFENSLPVAETPTVTRALRPNGKTV